MLECVFVPSFAIDRQLDAETETQERLAMFYASDRVVGLLMKSMGSAYVEPQLEAFRLTASLSPGRFDRCERGLLLWLFRFLNSEKSSVISWVELWT